MLACFCPSKNLFFLFFFKLSRFQPKFKKITKCPFWCQQTRYQTRLLPGLPPCRFAMALCHPVSRLHRLHLSLRSLLWIVMFRGISDPSRIWTTFRRFLNDYSYVASSIMLATLQTSTAANPRIVKVILRRRPWLDCWMTSTALLTESFEVCWSFWTCPRRSILSTSTHLFAACSGRLASTVRQLIGSGHTSPSDLNSCVSGRANLARSHANSVFPRVQCLAPSSSLSTLHQSQMSLHHMVSVMYNTYAIINFHCRIRRGLSRQCEKPGGDDGQWFDIQRTCRLHMQDIGISYQVASSHPEVHR